MGNRTAWQHPEAWLGSVTSIQGRTRMGEEAQRICFPSGHYAFMTLHIIEHTCHAMS